MSVSHAVTHVVTNKAGEVDLARITSLAAVFAQVTDPRKPKGVRRPLPAVLTVLTMALLCGARDFRQAADRVCELGQPLLQVAGARRHPVLLHGVTSLTCTATEIIAHVRGHWGIENKVTGSAMSCSAKTPTTPGSATSPTPWHPCAT